MVDSGFASKDIISQPKIPAGTITASDFLRTRSPFLPADMAFVIVVVAADPVKVISMR